MRIVLLLAALAFGAADKITYPYDFTIIPSGTRGALQGNFTSAKTAVDKHADTLDAYLSAKGRTGTGSLVYSIAPTVTNLLTVDSIVTLGAARYSGLTASKAVFTNANKELASINVTGSGSVVMSSGATVDATSLSVSSVPVVTTTGTQTLTNKTLTSPTINTSTLAGATLTGTLTNSGTVSGGTVNATTLQQGGVQAVTTTGTQTLTNKSIVASQITAGTFGSGDYTFSGKVLADSLRSTVGRVQAYNAGGQGTYIELGKYLGSLTGYPSEYRPTLKTDHTSIYFSIADRFAVEFGSGVSYNQINVLNNVADNSDIVFRTDGQTSYVRTGKFGVATATPDSTLTVSGSGRVSGNMAVGGNLSVSGTISGTYNPGLTASRTVITDGSGNFTVNTETGTGSHVRASGAALTGATTIASNSSGFYEEGSFTATWTGFTTALTSTVYYVRTGKQVTFRLGNITGTSNSANFFSDACIPVALRPLGACRVATSGFTNNNTAYHFGSFEVRNDGLIVCKMLTAGGTLETGFATSSNKGLEYASISCTLN